MRQWKIILAIIISAAAGFFGGRWWAEHREAKLLAEIRQIRSSDPQYKLIQPLLAIDFPESTFHEYTPLESKIQEKIDFFLNDKKAEKISVYFRDMKNGHWVGINENDTYTPASLLKVPVMMAYFKQAESEPEVLKKKVLYAKNEVQNLEDNQFEHPLVSGQEYTVEELLRNMIVYSDNNAFGLLLKTIDRNELNEVFTDLGVQFPGADHSDEYYISAKTYSLFFRILRNATFLDRDMSERALRLLTETTFKDGLVAGVPEGTVVAHKYGIYGIKENNAPQIGLHDCGIVYHPSTPYILCVMTSGRSLADLKETIKQISQLIYSEVK